MDSYICVNCGAHVKELFRKYSPSVLKVMSCNKCSLTADKYIEYDSVIIFIDLILLSKQAYRHVLYNTKFENHWKLAVVLLIMESYAEWVGSNSTSESKNPLQSHDTIIAEKSLYLNGIHMLLGTIVFVLIVFGMHHLMSWWDKNTYKSKIDLLFMCKALTLASFGKFMLLPALIWGHNHGNDLHVLFVTGYTILSQTAVYSIICNHSRINSMFIILVAFAGKLQAINLMKQIVHNDLFWFINN